MRVREIWRNISATRHTRALEAEVARLRAENRALLNSILGIAGVPPITVETPPLEGFAVPPAGAADREKKEASLLRSLGLTEKGKSGGETPALREGRLQVASPMRKRSWQQINRALEFESARKKERPGDAIPGNMSGRDGDGIKRMD